MLAAILALIFSCCVAAGEVVSARSEKTPCCWLGSSHASDVFLMSRLFGWVYGWFNISDGVFPSGLGGACGSRLRLLSF